MRQDFDEVGVEEAVLQELLRSWETKVAQSRVADFSSDPRIGSHARNFLPLPINTTATLPPPTPLTTTPTESKPKTEKVGGAGDEDEINSDLDDSDDEENVDDENGDSGDLIIALYEKVQRVKNKWKITLKDGIVSVGGKEYLFNKCSG